MPIRFACPYCEKISSVPDSFGGKKGKCPNCDKIIQVPDPNAGAPEADGEENQEPPPTAPAGDAAPAPAADHDGGMQDCRFCGESIKTVAKKCRYCGEFLDRSMRPERDRGSAPRFGRFSVGAAVQRGWDTAMANLGPALLVCLIYIGIVSALGVAMSFVSQAILVATKNHPAAVITAQLFSQLVSTVADTFLTLGLVKVALDMLRGRRVSIADVFGQGRFLLHLLLVKILLFLAAMVLLVPGVVLGIGAGLGTKEPGIGILVGMLFALPPVLWLGIKAIFVPWLIVDRDMDGISALKASFSLTSGHAGGLFALMIVLFGIMLAGVIAFCVGLLFAYPVAWLAIGTAYLCLAPNQSEGSMPPPAMDRI